MRYLHDSHNTTGPDSNMTPTKFVVVTPIAVLKQLNEQLFVGSVFLFDGNDQIKHFAVLFFLIQLLFFINISKSD